MGIKCRFVKKSEINKLLDFNRSQYRAGHILTEKKFIDWQFGEFPKKTSNYNILGAFDKKDNLLGVLGLIFLKYNFFGKEASGIIFSNLMVKKEYRNFGLGYYLTKKAESLGDFAVDFGFNKDAWRLFSKMDWQARNLKKYVFIINSKKAIELTETKNLIAASHFAKSSDFGNLTFQEIKKPEKEFADFWSRVKSRYPITIARDNNYLFWRYFNHPYVDYRIFTAKDGEKNMSIVVLRVEAPLGYRVGRIIDFVSEKEAAVFSLNGVVGYCQTAKIDFIDYFFSGSQHLSALKKAGFVDGYRQPYHELPILFNPIDRKTKKEINMAAIIKNKKLIKNSADIFDGWYETKGSGDQDRPF